MALNSNVLVELPEHNITCRTVSGKRYVYFMTSYYRNEKGKPAYDCVSIGKIDEQTGKLIPNRNYYEIYLREPAPLSTRIYDCGVNMVYESILKKVGVTSILKKYFPENYREILTVAQYILSEGNVMYYIDDYTECRKTSLGQKIDDAKCSRLFSSIRNEDILLFFREWMKQKKDSEYVAYDVTSISTYAKNINEAEWGYNRDKEKLPQINMGMYYGEESGLPLYYRIYPGSISDKAHLKHMVADNEFINGKKTRFVMDRGFYSKENLQFLTENGYRFVIALPGNLNYCNEIISKHKNKIVNHSECKLGKGLPYGKAYETDVLGFRMKIHLYYDGQKAQREIEALYELIERQENDLKSMEEPPERKLHYDKYFFINRSKDGKLGFVRNHKAIDEQLEKCGFFLIAETDFKKTTAEVLNIYRRRDVIEKSFDSLKNTLDMKRLHCYTDETANGKLFTAFIALIVKSYMQNELSQFITDNNFTFHKVMLELDKIKCLDLHSKLKPRLLNPLTKTQRAIFQALDIDASLVCTI